MASPAAKKAAKSNGIALQSVVGSGPFGRITEWDVLVAAGKAPPAPRHHSGTGSAGGAASEGGGGGLPTVQNVFSKAGLAFGVAIALTMLLTNIRKPSAQRVAERTELESKRAAKVGGRGGRGGEWRGC